MENIARRTENYWNVRSLDFAAWDEFIAENRQPAEIIRAPKSTLTKKLIEGALLWKI